MESTGSRSRLLRTGSIPFSQVFGRTADDEDRRKRARAAADGAAAAASDATVTEDEGTATPPVEARRRAPTPPQKEGKRVPITDRIPMPTLIAADVGYVIRKLAHDFVLKKVAVECRIVHHTAILEKHRGPPEARPNVPGLKPFKPHVYTNSELKYEASMVDDLNKALADTHAKVAARLREAFVAKQQTSLAEAKARSGTLSSELYADIIEILRKLKEESPSFPVIVEGTTPEIAAQSYVETLCALVNVDISKTTRKETVAARAEMLVKEKLAERKAAENQQRAAAAAHMADDLPAEEVRAGADIAIQRAVNKAVREAMHNKPKGAPPKTSYANAVKRGKQAGKPSGKPHAKPAAARGGERKPAADDDGWEVVRRSKSPRRKERASSSGYESDVSARTQKSGGSRRSNHSDRRVVFHKSATKKKKHKPTGPRADWRGGKRTQQGEPRQ